MEIIDGIGYGSRSGAIFMALDIPGYGPEGKAAAQAPAVKDYASTEWSPWGGDNLQPLIYSDHIENCGVLHAAMDAKARIAAGAGVACFFKTNVTEGKEELEYCNDSEINDWIEENDLYSFLKESSFDFNSYGWNAGTLILNKERKKINRLRRIDVYEARLAKKTGNQNFSTDIFLCADWTNGGTAYDTSKHVKIPLLEDGNEYYDLLNRQKGFEFAFANCLRRNGRQYYPIPNWFSSEAWVKVARSVPAYKNAIFKNQITIRYVVTIHPQYWSDKIKNWNNLDVNGKAAQEKLTYDRIDRWLSGEANSGKSLFNSGFFEKATGKFVPYVQVEAVDDKFADGKLLPDSAAANSEILFASSVSPAMMGVGQPGGPYSNNAGGSNIREGQMTQVMQMDADRKMNMRILTTVVKKFNGWSKRLENDKKKLVFRVQSNLLTTLDTGKSTKPETTG